MTLSKEVTEYVKSAIDRYAWSRWETRYEVLVEARESRGKYRCAHCKELFGPRLVQVDHRRARIDPEAGWQGFDEYVKRTFCVASGLQVLCRPCHNRKSAEENRVRAATKRKKK